MSRPRDETEEPYDFMTAQEAAVYLKVRVETVRRWAREGHIPCCRLGPPDSRQPDLRFSRSSLSEWAREREVEQMRRDTPARRAMDKKLRMLRG